MNAAKSGMSLGWGRLPVCRIAELPALQSFRRAICVLRACRLEVGDTAGWKPALRPLGPRAVLIPCWIDLIVTLSQSLPAILDGPPNFFHAIRTRRNLVFKLDRA